MKSMMPRVGQQKTRAAGWLWMLILCLFLSPLIGCEMDTFLDPSKPGRYEFTPVILPILKNLDVAEDIEEEILGVSEITPEDLIPEIREYVMGPGDLVTITIFELIQVNVESVLTRRIDELGKVRLPVLGEIKIEGLTTKQLEKRLADLLVPGLIAKDPIVSVVVQEGRQNRFHVMGAVGAAGTYLLNQNNFRLLDALALARDITPGVKKLYIIRHAPLDERIEKGVNPDKMKPGDNVPPPQGSAIEGVTNPDKTGSGEEKLDPKAFEDLLRKALEGDKKPDSNKPPGNPGTPGTPETKPPGDSPAPVKPNPVDDPIDPSLLQALEPETGSDAEGEWVFVNGKWVQTAAGRKSAGKMREGGLPGVEDLVTQRIIEVDVPRLLKGEARFNIAIRNGDVIRIPPPLGGNIYIGGEVARPGTYALPGLQQMTLKQIVTAAGGLGPTAIPERFDITRRLGNKDEEVTMRINYREIAEGLAPDFYLKPEDRIMVGTNAWATFLAVIRNAFRFSYGFGFLLDRNFGNDIFGAPPANRFGQ